ncbi:hypothetical protein S40285_08974 [Stachybotrys chlorohalonatus IBT 40285]|uniref:Heterokaryon incompatibility domain-containing protein n=1 Tax=Stachybotrys chlorohalonatus (strain IBT 40285) TaxID=1283841 RepID=A0A084QS64_STAC4|nr:hypothetical protein S40285_08974 [Stachybotrys chlorohalonata IBT 40285]
MALCHSVNLNHVPELNQLWVEADPGSLQCLACGQNFDAGTLIRTFRLCHSDSEEVLRYSRIIRTHLQQDIALYDRHLECMHGVEFFAISHVWNPEVSLAQQQGPSSPQPVEVRRITVEKPMRIYQGLDSFGPREVWNDYVSVPQWNSELKARILPEIHRLFGMARATVVVFDDLSPMYVKSLRHGSTSEERLKGLVGVCKAKWFQRMWTAMEFVRSHQVEMMTGDYKLVGAPNDPAFLGRIDEVWNQELKNHRWVHDLEYQARSFQLDNTDPSIEWQAPISKHDEPVEPNLIPWELGPLRQTKQIKAAPFAMATALLSRRRCRDELDFLHALRGIILAPSTLIASDFNFAREYSQAAKDCLSAGDHSPLIMTPAIPMPDPRLPSWNMFPTSLNDVYTWELGEEVYPAAMATRVKFDGEVAVLQAEKVGQIISTHFYIVDGLHQWPEPAIHDCFSRSAALSLEAAGPDINDFVASLSTRLFGLAKDASLAQLRETSNLDKLAQLLRTKHSTGNYSWEIDGPDGAFWLSKAMGLSSRIDDNSEIPLTAVHGRYGTMHCYPYGYLCKIKCDGCSKISMLRIGSFVPFDELAGAVAFRIPGLQYLNSLRDGVGILEKNGQQIIAGKVLLHADGKPRDCGTGARRDRN